MRFLALLAVLAAATAASAQTFAARTWQVGANESSDVDGTYVSQTSTAVAVRLASGRLMTLKRSSLGDEDLRHLRNVKTVTYPYRSWTRMARDRYGVGTPETFQAAIVNVTGFDSPLSRVHVEVVRSDTGQRKGYAYADLDAASRTYVDSVAANFPGPPAPNDGAQYAINSAEKPRDAHFNAYATDHFTFYWGDNVQSDATQWNDPAFRAMNFAYFERVWNYYRSIDSSLPYWNQATKYKTSVYITRTGLQDFSDGFAFGGESIVIAPAAMLEGSSVVPHEFGHTNQFWSGGYRSDDDRNINVGWVWECNANWNANSFVPGLALALGVYAERANYELDSSRMNYGSWPWLEAFADHPRFSRSTPLDMYKQAARDANGNATETPFQTTMRLGVQSGAFAGDGVAGFGDVIGEMAAHNAAWDYTYGQGYVDTLNYLFSQGIPSRAFTYLQPVPDRTGWWRPIYSQAPRQYGQNIVPLQLNAGETSVTATLAPIADETLGSNWRATLVAVDAFGNARYGRMWRTGTGRLKLKTGETAYLALVAAPDRYARQPFRPGYAAKRRFPYELSFSGCVPETTPVGLRDHRYVQGHAHPNGGGFVADSASVASTAYVGPNAQVLDGAQVSGTARIEDHATIGGAAVVSGTAVVGGYAYVRENATVTGAARVRDYALVQQRATIDGAARVREFVNVQGDGRIAGDAMVKGFGDVYTSPNAPVGGGTAIGQDAEIYFGDYDKPVDFGTLYGFGVRGLGLATSPSDGANFATDVRTDNKYLYAHWTFDKPRAKVLIDDLLDNDGVLRGGAAFKTVAKGSVLDLNGTDAYVALEGHAADAAGLTFDLQAYGRSTAAGQRLFTFAGSGGSISFTPRDASGKAALIVTNGTTTQTVVASQAIPLGAWSRVTIMVAPGSVKIYLDGTAIASSAAMTLSLDAIKADAGYLGRGTSGGYFNGQLYDVGIYRKAYASYAAFTPPYAR